MYPTLPYRTVPCHVNHDNIIDVGTDGLDEYDKYVKQHECLQKICCTFETPPNDMNTIMPLMTEMQTYGQPHQELVPLSEQGEGGLFPSTLPGGEGTPAYTNAASDVDANASAEFNEAEMKKMMDETCKTRSVNAVYICILDLHHALYPYSLYR